MIDSLASKEGFSGSVDLGDKAQRSEIPDGVQTTAA
jgi:hypothetical protein